jgi:hypothetical protein
VGLVPQLGAGVVEGQDLQEVRVKGSEVAGDLVVHSITNNFRLNLSQQHSVDCGAGQELQPEVWRLPRLRIARVRTEPTAPKTARVTVSDRTCDIVTSVTGGGTVARVCRG